jgi:hypothetical protein
MISRKYFMRKINNFSTPIFARKNLALLTH